MHSLPLISSFRGRATRLLCVGVTLLGCGTANDIQCRVTTAPDQAPADGTVTYHASITGDARIDSIVYKIDAGPTTVSYPTLPFELAASVSSGTALGLIVTGTAEEGGNIVAGYTFLDTAGTSPLVTSASCR